MSWCLYRSFPFSRWRAFFGGVLLASGLGVARGEETSPEVINLEAFRVATEAAADSALGLLQAQQRAWSVSDAIGSDQFGRLAVGDAAEAVGRLAGASVVDGKYVLIRGLGDRYANTLMNGATVPSADPDKRAVQLDQFPSHLLASVTTQKSFTPDQPGSFSGGSVNLRTKSFPEHFFFSLGTSLEYATAVVGEDWLSIPGGGRDWLGRDDGTRALPNLPASIPTVTAATLAARQGNFGPAETLDAASRAFDNRVYFPRAKRGRPGYGFNLSWGDRWESRRHQVLGYLASLTYDRRVEHYEGGRSSRYTLAARDTAAPRLVFSPDLSDLSYGQALPQHTVPGSPLSFGVTSSTEKVTWGAYTKVAFLPTPEHEVSLDLYYNQSADDNVRRGVGEDTNNYSGLIYEVYDLLYTERNVRSALLAGKSRFPRLGDLRLEWRLSRARSTQDQPDYRTLSALYNLQSNQYDNNTGVSPSRYFRGMVEDVTEGGLDFTWPFTWQGGREATLRWGAQMSSTDRAYRERRFFWSRATVQSRAELEAYPNPVGIIARTAQNVTFGNVITELSSLNNYEGEQEVAAGYVMVNLPLTPAWRMMGGVRFERTELETVPAEDPLRRPQRGEIAQTNALPALTLVRALTPKANLRAAYGRTFARPTFRELADIRYENVFNNEVYSGNPELELTVIDNYDLRWEWFPRSGEMVAASLFYKQLDRPIEVVNNPALGSIRPQNVEEGKVYGVELEVRRNLGLLAEALRSFTLGGNVALIASEVTIPADELAAIRSIDPEAGDHRKLLGQSPYTANLDLTYDRARSGTTATLSYQVTGPRLVLVTQGALADVFEQPSPDLTLVVGQRISERWRLRFSARNLLNSAYEESLRVGGRDLIYEGYREGRRFSLSFTYLFE